ncbi:ATP/GTP-binding protein [Anaeromyxobacter sp. PSR-1]|uniref:GTP-binding protein n=1 Tax=unclassified Anaeromyxobacter TaxID=2620896 RepID=UPI0005E13374|nr:GTPase domain-containing protein [Anaeromyxobacter sp. PSR-1]GAO03328.1 mutual gliding-motility protein MglA [Anaeromyxobacter sp. PSR-1]
MSTVNALAREISAKIVYYGPGLSGKTTSLQQIHASVRPESRGQLVSLSTEGDRTLFFDFLPLKSEQVRGLTLRLQLYTVPGQVFYDATRKLVLNGADGVVFVADSQASVLDSNLESFANLESNLAEMGIDLPAFPHVLQYNKRDLPGVLPVAELRRQLNLLGAPDFETVASRGEGLLAALKEITRRVVKDLDARHPHRAAPRQGFSGGGSELASRISAAAEAPEPAAQGVAAPAGRPPAPRADPSAPEAYRDRGQLLGLSFARMFPGRGAALADVEHDLRERSYGPAARRAAEAVAELLAGLRVDEAAPAARATLLGLDGREFLRLGRIAAKPDAAVTEPEALFALHLLVAAMVKLERI